MTSKPGPRAKIANNVPVGDQNTPKSASFRAFDKMARFASFVYAIGSERANFLRKT
jgi:hypothetical protein